MQANGNIFHWSYRLGRFFRRTRVLRSVFIACDRVRACVHARVHACVSEIPKSSDYLLLFLHLSTFSDASSFLPSFSSSREPFAGSERSSSPAAINLFRDELSRSSSPSLGLAILRFRDSSKEHPLGVRARSRRQRNCRIIQLQGTLATIACSQTAFNSEIETRVNFNKFIFGNIKEYSTYLFVMIIKVITINVNDCYCFLNVF